MGTLQTQDKTGFGPSCELRVGQTARTGGGAVSGTEGVQMSSGNAEPVQSRRLPKAVVFVLVQQGLFGLYLGTSR